MASTLTTRYEERKLADSLVQNGRACYPDRFLYTYFSPCSSQAVGTYPCFRVMIPPHFFCLQSPTLVDPSGTPLIGTRTCTTPGLHSWSNRTGL